MKTQPTIRGIPASENPMVNDYLHRSRLLRLLNISQTALWIIVGILTITILQDLHTTWKRSAPPSGDRAFVSGMVFYQNGQKIENRDSESGIWISGRDYALIERGRPKWGANLIVLISAITSMFAISKVGSSLTRPQKTEQTPTHTH
ncbi:MAG: hypothetical protein QM627_13510 [Luteolibacter sp.]